MNPESFELNTISIINRLRQEKIKCRVVKFLDARKSVRDGHYKFLRTKLQLIRISLYCKCGLDGAIPPTAPASLFAPESNSERAQGPRQFHAQAWRDRRGFLFRPPGTRTHADAATVRVCSLPSASASPSLSLFPLALSECARASRSVRARPPRPRRPRGWWCRWRRFFFAT